MRVLLTGSSGQLGQALLSFLPFEEIITPDRKELNLTDPQATFKYFTELKPDLIIHCAALTDVDKCEVNSGEAFRVNYCGTINLVRAAACSNPVFFFISTNFVFNGKRSRPYLEEDFTEPLNVYGLTKLLAEEYIRKMLESHFIIRTSWLYGGKDSFVTGIIKRALEGNEIYVAEDQYASPTYANDLARALIVMLKSKEYGTYHLINRGYCSRYEWVKQLLLYTGINTMLSKVEASYFSTPARRPQFAVLENCKYKKVFGLELRDWREGLYSYLNENKAYWKV